jgi:nicotinamidase-related amidase
VKRLSAADLAKSVVISIDVENAFGEHARSEKLRGLRDSERGEVEKVVRLSEAVHEAGGAVVVVLDRHNRPGTILPDGSVDNRSVKEFEIYGAHAVTGSRDAQMNPPLRSAVRRMEAREGKRRTVIPTDRYDRSGRSGASRLFEVHKNTYDVTKRLDLDGELRPHAGFINLIAKLKTQGYERFLLTGKIAEVCVRSGAESIRELFPELDLAVVADAVCSLPTEVAKAIGLDSKEEVLAALEADRISVCVLSDVLPTSEFIADGITGR